MIEIRKIILFVSICFFLVSCNQSQKTTHTQVLVIGAGTGATSAAIQSARSGAKTVLINPIPWLGGMMTAAGVSATDGNHKLPAGLWGEFRDSLRNHYGGADSLFTGWVSNTMFEPKIGDYYWKQIVKNEPNLTIHYNTRFDSISRAGDLWKVSFSDDSTAAHLYATIVIDGTDLGDVAAQAGASYDVGMNASSDTGEIMAPEEANDIIQDLTYAAILKDYGVGKDMTITKPTDYDPSQFYCSCQDLCDDPAAKPHPCETMLNYGKLPNGKYMINWPLKGNDYYTNIIDMNAAQREAALEKAKQKTLQFIYFIQTELEYNHLGIADDEFPTEDGLPLMPYHREGRRIHGLVQLSVSSIVAPYSDHLYRTGIAVGDYPIDHHHFERPDAPEIEFPKVPSFSIPIGALIPKDIPNFIMADKAISVTNIVNGASRLQPVIVQVGQVAGLLGALSIQENTSPSDLDIRTVQQQVLEAKGYLLPFIDVTPDHPYFESIQRVSASGLLRGYGIPYKWANQTWFYPDSIANLGAFVQGLKQFEGYELKISENKTPLHSKYLLKKLSTSLEISIPDLEKILFEHVDAGILDWNKIKEKKEISRAELAVLLDVLINPFEKKINMHGDWKIRRSIDNF